MHSLILMVQPFFCSFFSHLLFILAATDHVVNFDGSVIVRLCS